MIALVLDACRRACVPVLLAGLLSACALGQSVIEVKPPEPTAASVDVSAPLVQIVEVQDERIFTAAPRDPSEPSLEHAEQMADPSIRARALGRKRNTYGAALGDVVLKPETTVAALVRSTAETALTDKGYRVAPNNTNPPDAIPLKIRVQQLWGWITPGMWSIKTSFKANVTLESARLLSQPSGFVEAGVENPSGMVTESVWVETIQKGLAELKAKIGAAIKEPAAAR